MDISKKPNNINTNITNRMKFINGWLVSIAGLLLLWS